MTHELKQIVAGYRNASGKAGKAVLATVVALQGSSYRRPGVRMLIFEDGTTLGAVSGGCVEREVCQQSTSVFLTGSAKMITYDGRFRLGCEGILYILLEPFHPKDSFYEGFEKLIDARKPLELVSYYQQEVGVRQGMGTVLRVDGQLYPMGADPMPSGLNVFEQQLPPSLRLLIFGGEHDTVQLAAMAGIMGWDVRVTVAADEAKKQSDFPGANQFEAVIPEKIEPGSLDPQTAVVLMTHSYTKDLKYLLRLVESRPGYLGLLGPAARRERLLGDVMERYPDLQDAFFDQIHGPAGLDIGAETPQEIAVAVLSEILAVFRKASAGSLREKEGGIHSG